MMNLTDSLNAAVAWIEAHLEDDLDVQEIAARAYLSAYHFQRVFSAMCGVPVGEYIRRRRLTLAAQEILRGMRVIDTAVKYGYDSPDAFARAFRRFHGMLPSQAGQPGVVLQAFYPVKFTRNTEVRPMLEYRIAEKAPFTIVGYSRKFHSDTSYQEIPRWWDEMMARGMDITPVFGACIDEDGKVFDYMIADLYHPWQEVPEGCVTHAFPRGTWAVFPCTQGTLQSTNTRMWAEWLPGAAGWRLAGRYNLEVYGPPAENPQDSYVELWLPIVRA